MASQDAWARPLATQLVDLFRVGGLDYVRVAPGMYDPETGEVANTETVYPAAGALTKTYKSEEGGAAEPHTIEAWIDAKRIDDVWPTTADQLSYDGARWKINNVYPMFSGDMKYACKVVARRT